MRTDNNHCFCRGAHAFMPFLMCIAFSICLCSAEVKSTSSGAEDIDFTAFRQALEASEEAKAASIGNSILGRFAQKYRRDSGFRTYKSKLDASEFLATQMISHLHKAAGEAGNALADVFAENKVDNKTVLQSIAPAKKVYETSVKLFSAPIAVAELPEQEKNFLAQYYDLRLRILTTKIAKAGQGLAIAEPDFKATYDYVLVLPLLHGPDQKRVNIDVLPRWMQTAEQLAVLSDSCLLHFGFPFHAMTLAERAAKIQDKPFSEVEFYKSAARRCGAAKAHIAAECLHKAMDSVAHNDPNVITDLQSEIVQLWLDSRNYSLAAGEARNIFETHPEHEQAAKAIWLYYYALSRSNKIDEILLHIDEALADSRCEPHKPRLMYVKWWALRRHRDKTAALAALEYELVAQYGNDPMIAPVLLSQATDLLSRQDYNGAYELLSQMVEKFPETKAAGQAKKMLEKLKSNK
ncbi:MAG: tetratricopeptide repeat protein [Planctomycetota bacterium]